jgi:hypothetical protein
MTTITVTSGIAPVAPTYFDFDDGEHLSSDAWLKLTPAVQSANQILDALDECNPPNLKDRWELHRALVKIREAADALERHIANNGLWLSEDEWAECDSYGQ